MSFTHISPANNYTIIEKIPEKYSKFFPQVEEDETFWVGDFAKVDRAIEQWDKNLPRINMCYAVKCCNEPGLVKYMIKKGKGFDCASKSEIKQCIELGADPNKILFAHPLKSKEAILYAKAEGVKKLVVETEDELLKIKKWYEGAEIFIRIMPRITKALIQLSEKFGAFTEAADKLVEKCKELNMNLIGFSLHVGSLCDDVETFGEAIKVVQEYKQKAEKIGFKITFVDIGGGFNAPSCKTKYKFEDIAKSINDSIDQYINDPDVKFYAEPGRFIGNDFLDLCLPIICAKQKYEGGEKKTQLIYIPDGMYGAFNALTYDHAEPHFMIKQNEKNDEIYETKLYGQTCDSADVVYVGCKWPKLSKGDFMYVENFGAYTYSPTSFFNGFFHHKVFYLNQ